MKRQLHFLDRLLNKIQNLFSELQVVPSATSNSTRQGLIVKQRNLWPNDMQGLMIDAPLNPSTYLPDPFDSANKTKTKEVHFSAYPKSPLINTNQRISKLSGRQNEESWNSNNATSSYNQVYVDALLSRQLQNEESNTLEQRIDALIKKRELIQNRKASFNSHYELSPQEHEQSIQIDPSGYDHDTTIGKNIGNYQTTSHEYHDSEQIPLYHSGNGNPPPGYTNSSISGDSELSSFILVLSVEWMDI